MINPQAIIDYNRTTAEKQELLLFLVAVAGKKATTVARQLEEFMPTGILSLEVYTPFQRIKDLDVTGQLQEALVKVRFGQYNRLTKAFKQLSESNLDLDTCTLENLLSVHGIGRKSASCFLMWTRKGQRVSGLDVHLLKYLVKLKKDMQVLNEVKPFTASRKKVLELLNSVEIPKSTPGSKRVYDALEQAFLLTADYMGKAPEDWDLEIWKHYAGKGTASAGKA